MNITKIALSSAAALGFAAALATPALAFTHHPATPEEIQQTDQLNAQSLAAAQGANTGTATPAPTSPAPDQGSVGTAPAVNAPDQTPAPAATPMPAPNPNDQDNTMPNANNQNPASPEPASGIAPKTPQ